MFGRNPDPRIRPFLEAFKGVCRGVIGLRRSTLRQTGKRGTGPSFLRFPTNEGKKRGGDPMGRGLLLWIIGIPLPIILVIWLLGGLN
jgi:hypothetical protein